MARDSKIEVAALNLRIPRVEARDYVGLLKDIRDLKTGFRVYGDTFLTVTSFNERTSSGILSKYTEIDLDGDWFDTETGDAATDDEVASIDIPEKLKPNLAQFYFILDPELHCIAFEAYSDSKGLSLNGAEKFFKTAVLSKDIYNKYGRVEVSIINDHLDAARLLALPDIKDIKIVIRRPNADDMDDDLAKVIEERLRGQNADEYEESLRAKGNDSVEPNERTKKLAILGAENGDVLVKSKVDGVLLTQKVSKTPLKAVEKYKSDQSTLVHFRALAQQIFNRIRGMRRDLRG